MLALVVAVGASSAIPTYLFCAASQRVHLSCCCPSHDDAATLKAPCCEARDALAPDGTEARSFAPRVALAVPAVVVAVLPLEPTAPHAALGLDREALARAGPSERIHAVNSIYLL